MKLTVLVLTPVEVDVSFPVPVLVVLFDRLFVRVYVDEFVANVRVLVVLAGAVAVAAAVVVVTAAAVAVRAVAVEPLVRVDVLNVVEPVTTPVPTEVDVPVPATVSEVLDPLQPTNKAATKPSDARTRSRFVTTFILPTSGRGGLDRHPSTLPVLAQEPQSVKNRRIASGDAEKDR